MKEKDILALIDEKRTEMQGILDTAESGEEKRTVLNEDEQTRFDALMSEVEGLGTQLENLQKLASIPSTKPSLSAKIAKGVQQRSGLIENGDTEATMRKRYSVLDAMAAITGIRSLSGIEKEAHETASEELRAMDLDVGSGVNIPAFFVSKAPMSASEAQARSEMSEHEYEKLILDEQQRVLVVGTDTAGGHARPTFTQRHIEFLRPDLQIEQAGARVLTGLTGDLKFPRQDAIPSIAWEGETDSTASMEGTLDAFTLAPKRAAGYTDVATQLIIQGGANFDAEMFARTDLNYGTAYGVEDVALEGGAANAPTGITQTSGIGSVALGTNGGAITWAKVIEFMTDLAGSNAYQGRLGWYLTPEMIGAMFTVKRDAGSGIFVMPDPGTHLLGHPVFWSNVLPKDLTKGTGTALHAAIMGDFSQLIVAQWGGIQLVEDPYTQALLGTKRIVINSYWDIGVRHPESFSAILDFDPTA